MVAMLIFEPLRTSIKSKAERRWYDELALFATDPLGVVNSALERLFGIKSEIRVSPARRVSLIQTSAAAA